GAPARRGSHSRGSDPAHPQYGQRRSRVPVRVHAALRAGELRDARPVTPDAPTPAAPLALALEGGRRVSALLQAPRAARACCVLAHGAGAGMSHPFMAAVADGLAARGIATLRYQFPYMERGAKRPDPPKLAQATVRAAVSAAARRLPDTPLFAGGKSFGGRMTSQAQAAEPLPGVRGLA